MPLLAKASSFLRNLFSSNRVEADLDQEIHSHLEMLIDEKIRGGMSPQDAQRAARIEIGGTEQVKEQVREVRIGFWFQSVASDCRYGLRQLRKNRAFSAVAVVTFALSIGANVLVFCVLNALILRPLNVPRPESLYSLQRANDFNRDNRIPAISNCAIATAASKVWPHITFCRQDWTLAKIHHAYGCVQ
jgi:hypothetical protein